MAQRFSSLSDPGFRSHFAEFQRTAFRMETLQNYDVSYERPEFERFLSGESRGRFPGLEGWLARVSEGTRRGKEFQRVHILEEPLSDYARFECLWSYRHTVAAGEDVRIIPVAAGHWPEDLPRQDFWLFDSRRLVLMNYRPDGTFASAEAVDDPDRVARAAHWRDQAVAASIPFPRYAQRFDDLMLNAPVCPG
ncbi:DUF6879 family protein [Streptomyces sp. YIM 98790]|uniref:DUF6879 family protein n=1 Tax=Streptomyces sp. YIM 98790 TaxID=2689077 RepID=UPI00140808DD|nr:DUF6879 family protein [Streptomyces sp. YIM 98790]